MTVTLTQHIPTFVEMGDTPAKRAEVSSAASVLALPWVQSWERHYTGGRWYVDEGRHLMIDGTRDGTRSWWVVGTFSEPVAWFPAWPGP